MEVDKYGWSGSLKYKTSSYVSSANYLELLVKLIFNARIA